MLTALQKATAQAIVNIFEGSSVRGNYAAIALIPGDTGQLSYGKLQVTLGSGSLAELLGQYCGTEGCGLGGQLEGFLPKCKAKDSALNNDQDFRALLKQAGADPVMQSCQDDYFDDRYWAPAMRQAAKLGFQSALAASVVYDGFIQGAWGKVRDLTNAAFGSSEGREKEWVEAYVRTRRDWLANHSKTYLHGTVYRMDAYLDLIAQGAWDLPLPITVRKMAITAEALAGAAAAPLPPREKPPAARLLYDTDPNMEGDDVEALQERLTAAGFPCSADGEFGPGTAKAVRAFQASKGLTADGIVGAKTRQALGL